MKRTLSFISLVALILVFSCQRVENVPATVTQVPVRVGGMISGIAPGYDTKAESLSDYLGGTLPDTLQLPSGTTMYLMIEVKDGDEWVQDKENYPLKAYVVGGANSLFPCTVDDEGNCLSQTGSPLMLGEGKYRFHAVSPARRIHDMEINGTLYEDVMPIRNGDYVIASDPRWVETAPTEAEVIITTGDAVMPITLNPLINQTAEMVFNLKKGKNVTKLEILPEGVDLSGIQDDGKTGAVFHWSIGGAELPMKVGDKYHGVKVRDWKDTSEGLRGTVSVLPTDATTNAIFLLFNIAVNDVPTQYMATLNQQYYRSSHRYTYNFVVDVEDGITVAAWDNITITMDGDFTEPGEQDYTGR